MACGIATTTWMAGHEDARLREETLIEADLAATGIDPGRLSLLSGSDTDFNSPVYRSLKKQMASITAARPMTRFAYIMGQRKDGTVFFFVDSEPEDSPDYSPPGQEYTEAPPTTLEVFKTGISLTGGPVTDRWGSWVSGLIPIKDPDSGKILGVFGIDVDTKNWNRDIIIAASLPAIASLMFSILILFFILVHIRSEKERNLMIASQKALAESEKRYSAIVNNAPEPVLIHDKGEVLFINRSGEGALGYTAEEMVGTDILSYLPRQSHEKVKQAMHSRQRGFLVDEYEMEFIRKDGIVLTFTVKGTSIRYRERDAVLVHLNDITERKGIQMALQETERKLVDIINFLPYPTLVTDASGIVTWWNRAIEVISGVNGSEIVGKNILDYPFKEGFRPVLIRSLLNADTEKDLSPEIQKDGNTWFIEFRLRGTGEPGRYLLSRASRLYHQDGDVVGAIESVHDITFRKKRENALRQVNQQLNLMTSITRHDIRNAVTVIRGYLDLVMEDLTQPDATRYLILGKASLLRILDQIEFTKIYQEIGLKEPAWQKLQDLLSSLSPPEGVALELRECSFLVYADLLLINVFKNLLDNSIRHGERVSVINIWCKPGTDQLVIVYEDDGIGINPDEKDLIFERGYGKNTGFGLFLIREILSITGISITALGKPGEGARFEIKVPFGCYRAVKD